MTAKELLLQYENDRRKENRLRSEILWTREMIRSLDLIPCRFTRQMKEALSCVEENLRIYEEDLVAISKDRQRISRLISDVPGIEGEVLTRRYIDGQIWEEISEGIHYSTRGVFAIHNRALQMIQGRLDQGDLL